MAARTWSSAGSTDLNDPANYSGAGALLAADDLTFDNTSVIDAAATANLAVNSVTIAANYTGTWSLSGFTATFGNGFSDDGTTGAHDYGNGITCNGASGTFHVGSGVGTVTATSCVLTMNGTTGMVIDDDKGVTFKSLTLGAAAVVVSSGGAGLIVAGSQSPMITLGNNATFTNSVGVILRPTATVTLFSVGAGVVLNGTGTFTVLSSGISTITIPAITYSGSGTWSFSDYTAGTTTFNFTGDFNIGSAGCTLTMTYGYAISCGTFTCGSNRGAVAPSPVYNFSSSSFAVSSVVARVSAFFASTINLQTSTWTCAGNWTFGSNHTVNPGTSTVRIAGNSTITSNGKSFFNIVFNTAAVTFTLAGDLTIADAGSFTHASGTFTPGANYIVFAGSGFIITGAMNCRLRTAVAGSTIVWNIGADTWTIPAYTANDWGSLAGPDVLWVSSTPGVQYRISAPAGVVVSNMYPTDNNNVGVDIDATDGTSVDGGNNIGWLFPAPGGPSQRNSKSRIAITMGL